MSANWKDVITLTIGSGGLIFGLYQYWIAQRLSKAKFAAEITDKIYQDEELRAAWNFIDSDNRDMFLPAKCSQDGKNPIPFPHKIKDLQSAMNMQNRQILSTGFTDLKDEYRKFPYVQYVGIFDRCFSFMEGVYSYHDSGLIEARHVPHLLYMLSRIDQLEFGGTLVFEEYLVYYKYDRVIRLIEFAKLYLNLEREWLFTEWILRRRAKSLTAQRISRINERLRLLPQQTQQL